MNISIDDIDQHRFMLFVLYFTQFSIYGPEEIVSLHGSGLTNVGDVGEVTSSDTYQAGENGDHLISRRAGELEEGEEEGRR
jgi:hypothetical protein